MRGRLHPPPQLIEGRIGLSRDQGTELLVILFESALLSAATRESRGTVGRPPALQEFLNKGATDAKLISDLLLRVVRMILKEPDDFLAEVIGIREHVLILADDYPYTQVKTDLS